MRRFDDFCKALKNLEEVPKCREPYSVIELSGMVALYQICFEQAWKAIKEALEASGFGEGKTGSPKQILKTAYSAGMLRDERLWLEALETRNRSAHAYNEAVAQEIVQATKQHYIAMFTELRSELEENWIDRGCDRE